AQANGRVNQQGALADYLEVVSGYERAVEGCLGDLLQHVIVRHPDDAQAGFEVLREAGAGRCGFLIASDDGEVCHSARAAATPRHASELPQGVTTLTSVVRVSGPFTTAILETIGEGCIVESFGTARTLSETTALPIVTMDGD